MGGRAHKILPLIALASVGVATGGFGLAAGAGAGAGAGAAAAGGGAASTGFFSSLAALPTSSQIGLGLQAVSTAGSMFGGDGGQKAMLAQQQGQRKLQNARDGLDLSQRELGAQKKLRKTLAALSVRANAFGGDLSSGSGENLMDSSYLTAQNELDLYGTQRQLIGEGARTSEQTYAFKRRAVGANKTHKSIGSLLNFGVSAARRIGRA